MENEPELTGEIVRACLNLGKRHFPKPWPTVYDRDDQQSDFMLGLVHGSRRQWWKAEDPIKFLVKYGVWAIRRRRYRLLMQKFNILCECGEKLKINQQPCHGTMSTREIGPKIIYFDEIHGLVDLGEKAREWMRLGERLRRRRSMIPGFELGV